MNRKDFILRLANSFEISEITQSDIIEWTEQTITEDHNLHYLYNMITQKHKYKKINLAAIIDYWKQCIADLETQRISRAVNIYSDEWIIKHTKNWTAEEIINKYCEIRKMQYSDKELEAKYISFLCVWEGLSMIWEMLEMKGWPKHEIINYCERVKENRVKGIKKHYIPDDAPRAKKIQRFDELPALDF